MHKYVILLFTFSQFMYNQSAAQQLSLKKAKKEITGIFSQQPGVFALAFKDLQTGKTIYMNEHEIFHAASTMKTPVLIEAYKQAAAGKISVSDSVIITNNFQSIVDTSHFSLHVTDDSEPELYKHIGEKTSFYNLLYQMIIYSSNLATNIVIDKLGATNVTATVRSLGAGDIQVYAEQKLDAEISGAGSVSYKGHPVVTSQTSGVGGVEDAN